MVEAVCPRCLAGPGNGVRSLGSAALFLDRDGVINRDAGYTHRRQDFKFLPGIFELARAAAARGLAIIVVTNQAGIARGLYDEAAVTELTQWMFARFLDEGVAISRHYFCPHHPEAVVPAYRMACACRKPQPGMILAAAGELGIDLARSIPVGDKASDVLAGRAAGVGALVLLGDDPLPTEPEGLRRVKRLSASILC